MSFGRYHCKDCHKRNNLFKKELALAIAARMCRNKGNTTKESELTKKRMRIQQEIASIDLRHAEIPQ